MNTKIIVQVSDCVKSTIGETEKAYIIDLIEKSLFKDCPVKIHVVDNPGAWKPIEIGHKVAFYIDAQRGTFRFNNRMFAYPSAYSDLLINICDYLNSKKPLKDDEYQLRRSFLSKTEI